MAKLLIVLTAVALALLIDQSQAQQCGPCAKAKTVAACVQCSQGKNAGNWTRDGMTGWCVNNMPACRGKK